MPELPQRLGVFPLPHVVLFPHTQLPLHVFEPRYRELIRYALATSNRFVMAVLKPGYEEEYEGNPAVWPVACAGRIVEHELLPDGRSDLILEGEQVVRIDGFAESEPFRIAQVTPQPDDRRFVEGPHAGVRIAELSRLLEAACPGCVQALAEQLPRNSDADRGLQLLHTIAMHLPVEVERKLEWLRCPDTLERWRSLRETLATMGEERARRQTVVSRYADLAPVDPVRN
jgi:Lon protease-like protein